MPGPLRIAANRSQNPKFFGAQVMGFQEGAGGSDKGAGAEKAGGGSWQTHRQKNPLPGALNTGIMLNPTLLAERLPLMMQPLPS